MPFGKVNPPGGGGRVVGAVKGDGGVCQIKITPLRPLTTDASSPDSPGELVKGTTNYFLNKCRRGVNVCETFIEGGKLPSLNRVRRIEGLNTFEYAGSERRAAHQRAAQERAARKRRNIQLTRRFPSSFYARFANASHSSFALASPARLLRSRRYSMPKSNDDNLRRAALNNDPRKSTQKILRVTRLVVAQPFPNLVGRQNVASRIVYTQSPLEANVNTVASWCSILFQTVLATSNLEMAGG